MAAILIIGESGTGKSTSIRTLNNEETYIINVLDKPLPFRGSKSKYIQKKGGNYYATDDARLIYKIVKNIHYERRDIKNIIIDDFQYIMSNESIRRALETGYNKFSEIQQKSWSILDMICHLSRPDLNVFILSHSCCGEDGISRFKTIGNMLDKTIVIDGMFTYVIRSIVKEGQYRFEVKNNGLSTVKMPFGMFEENETDIENDLQLVLNKIKQYEKEDDNRSLFYDKGYFRSEGISNEPSFKEDSNCSQVSNNMND